MAPTVDWVYNLCKEDLVKLYEKFRIEATGSHSELHTRFVAMLRRNRNRRFGDSYRGNGT
jgi:hypothetical protein